MNHPINAQTPGPLQAGTSLRIALHIAPLFQFTNEPNPYLPRPDTADEDEANARLLAASYTAYDKAGRELGIDAAELAKSLDLAALIRAAREVVSEPSITTPGIERIARIINQLPHSL